MICSCKASALLLFAALSLAQEAKAAEMRKPVVMSAEEFSRLSADEQRALLVRVFERRLEHARNLRWEAEEVLALHEKRGEDAGNVLEQGPPRHYRHWHLGTSYRIDTDLMDEKREVEQRVKSGFNADQGVSRITGWRKGETRPIGRIDSAHDTITIDNRFKYWTDGEYPHKAAYLFRYLVDPQRRFEIKSPVDHGKVQLTVDFTPWDIRVGRGKQVLVLDPQKGFLPVSEQTRWDDESVSPAQWRIHRFTVHESQLVGDVWMPVRLTASVAGSPSATTFAVYEIKLTRMEHGTVKPSDLEIAFAEDTRVMDVIQGVTYKCDASGKPKGPIEPMYGAVPGQPKAETAQPWLSRRWGVTLGSVGVLGVIVVVLFWRRRRAPAAA